MKNPTYIFENYEAFQAFIKNNPKTAFNGVSKEFAEFNPTFREENTTNDLCWNCTRCTYCFSCYACVECTNCEHCENLDGEESTYDSCLPEREQQ